MNSADSSVICLSHTVNSVCSCPSLFHQFSIILGTNAAEKNLLHHDLCDNTQVIKVIHFTQPNQGFHFTLFLLLEEYGVCVFVSSFLNSNIFLRNTIFYVNAVIYFGCFPYLLLQLSTDKAQKCRSGSASVHQVCVLLLLPYQSL